MAINNLKNPQNNNNKNTTSNKTVQTMVQTLWVEYQHGSFGKALPHASLYGGSGYYSWLNLSPADLRQNLTFPASWNYWVCDARYCALSLSLFLSLFKLPLISGTRWLARSYLSHIIIRRTSWWIQNTVQYHVFSIFLLTCRYLIWIIFDSLQNILQNISLAKVSFMPFFFLAFPVKIEPRTHCHLIALVNNSSLTPRRALRLTSSSPVKAPHTSGREKFCLHAFFTFD